ncbi:hypothetical protein [Pedococcus sp. 2YAF34]|uniref:hypothetical protein n=1 Tax=Pedococcus sp. 2YAF34 TaxID=3233032 RepID=UPI003F97F21D
MKPVGRILTNAMGASTDPTVWLRETAVLRLVAVVEAYVDAVSMHRMTKVLDARPTLVALMLRDFELTSSGTWQARHDAYDDYHHFSLRSRNGWGTVTAGIDVRNCLAHGLGTLTAKQRGQTKLPSIVKVLDVSIGGNRMHLSATTVPRLAAGCEQFVRHVDQSLDLAAP